MPCMCLPPAPQIVHPNPADDILTIDLTPQTLSGTTPNLTYDVRLYDASGNIVRRQQQVKAGEVKFNVFNLPEGTYYLHIYDGVNKTPQMHQIVVKR